MAAAGAETGLVFVGEDTRGHAVSGEEDSLGGVREVFINGFSPPRHGENKNHSSSA